MQKTMVRDTETSPTSESEIKITAKENEKSSLRLVGKYNPLLDTWATSDGTEQKAVSELTYDSCLQKLYFTIKLITQALVFLITLAAGVVSRGITFFMVSQLSAQAVTVCSSQGAVLASNTAFEKVNIKLHSSIFTFSLVRWAGFGASSSPMLFLRPSTS